MGHYASEMASDPLPTPRDMAVSEVRKTLGDRGYEGVAVSDFNGIVHLLGGGGQVLTQHECGAIVGDPDLHDKYCPARSTD